MIPVISIVGKKNSGKTTLMEQLILELKKRGYSVATIKHSSCDQIEVDQEGKDSFRHLKAGAESTVLSSSNKIVIQKNLKAEVPLDEIVGLCFEEADIILTEGYKGENKPKIEIVHEGEPQSSKDELIAIVSNTGVRDDTEVPLFKHSQREELVNFIERKFLKTKPDASATLIVDGKEIKLNCFVRDFIRNTVLGMISSLRGVEEPDRVIFKLRKYQ